MFTIFQISDLHFGEDLIPGEKSMLKGLSGHDERTWVAFKDCLSDKIKNVKNDYIVCVSGDLSAFGNIKSYNLASELIFNESHSEISKKYGLRLNREKVLIIPGNHDSYDNNFLSRNNLRTFNGIFNPSNPQYPIIKKIVCGTKTIRIIGLDSTYKKTAVSLSKKLGKGNVDSFQIRRLKAQLDSDTDYFNIVVIHHSPIIVNNHKSRTLMLDRSHELLESLQKFNVKLVLCGHLHDDFYESLPLKAIIKTLPKRRGLKSILFNIFKESIINDYKEIVINGKRPKYMDSIAYQYLKQNGVELLDVGKRSEIPSVDFFNNYIRKVPEYNNFIRELNKFSNEKIAIIMCGSTCQENKDLKNSCMEITINDTYDKITIDRYKYIREKITIEKKERVLEI